jgi:hypothetical protein
MRGPPLKRGDRGRLALSRLDGSGRHGTTFGVGAVYRSSAVLADRAFASEPPALLGFEP